MSEGFVPLTLFLRPLPPQPVVSATSHPPVAAEPLATASSHEAAREYAAAFGAVRRFHAAISDALEVAVQQLLSRIGEDVLARELKLGGADVAAVVAKTRERFADERILAVRVHPNDRNALAELEIDTVVDETLCAGDVVVELRSGTIDLRLRARLAIAIAACA